MNPRAAINDLLPFQGSPFGQLGYFSKLPYLLSSSDIHLCHSQRQVILYLVCFILSSTFLTFLKSFYFVFDKRREWDSNPRALADKRFSRPPRYDHFDISPYIIIKPKTLCTSRVVLHSRGCLCQCKTYSIIKTFLCQQDFLFFSKIHSISQKSLCNRQIFWCSDLDILVGSLHKKDLGSSLLLHYHCIICYPCHVLFAYAFISSANQII